MTFVANAEITFNMAKEFTFDGKTYQCVDNPLHLRNKPIVVDNVPIGTITEAILDSSGTFFKCKGILFSQFMSGQFIINQQKGLHLSALVLGKESFI